MPTFSLEVNGDLEFADDGSLKMVSGPDEIIQRIIRRVVTNPQSKLDNGQIVAADYIFAPTYGLGMGVLVESEMSEEIFTQLSSIVRQGVLEDAEVDSSIEPDIRIKARDNDTVIIEASFRTTAGQDANFTLDIV